MRLDDEGDSDDEVVGQRLTAARAVSCAVEGREGKHLDCSGGDYVEVEDLSELRQVTHLKVDGNQLSRLTGLSRNVGLVDLNAARNKLESLTDVAGLPKLRVLNASNNAVRTLDGFSSSAILALRVLVLSNNEIRRVDGLRQATGLETLVLSHNEIEDIAPLTSLSNLVKLSCSHNRVRRLPDMKHWIHMAELRLSHNKISSLPQPDEMSFNAKLKIVDLGHNPIRAIADKTGTSPLSSLPALRNLNLTACPVVETASFSKIIGDLLPKLRLLNSHRLDGPGRRGKGVKEARENREVNKGETSQPSPLDQKKKRKRPQLSKRPGENDVGEEPTTFHDRNDKNRPATENQANSKEPKPETAPKRSKRRVSFVDHDGLGEPQIRGNEPENGKESGPKGILKPTEKAVESSANSFDRFKPSLSREPAEREEQSAVVKTTVHGRRRKKTSKSKHMDEDDVRFGLGGASEWT